MKLNPGDIYKIETKIGYGFLQYIETSKNKLQYVRVLDFLSNDGVIEQEAVDLPERWNIEFPLKSARYKKIVELVGNYQIPKNYKVAEYARTKHIIRDDFLGWHIVNRSTLKRTLKEKLTKDEKKLSPYGIFNDTLIKEYLEENWRLENWE